MRRVTKRKLKIKTINAILKLSSKKQNKIKPLNAGQLREQIKINLDAIRYLSNEMLSEVLCYLAETVDKDER